MCTGHCGGLIKNGRHRLTIFTPRTKSLPGPACCAGQDAATLPTHYLKGLFGPPQPSESTGRWQPPAVPPALLPLLSTAHPVERDPGVAGDTFSLSSLVEGLLPGNSHLLLSPESLWNNNPSLKAWSSLSGCHCCEVLWRPPGLVVDLKMEDSTDGCFRWMTAGHCFL